MTMTGKLIIVPTPLGNLGDMTARALKALEQADVVCAEHARRACPWMSCRGRRP